MKQGDRVQETSTTTGTGSLTLAGATAGHRNFLVEIGETDETTYLIQASDGAWEISRGTLTGTSLTRTLIKSSTSALLDLPAGTHYVSQVLDAATVNTFGAVEPPLTLASGTITTSQPALNITQTWNDAAVTFEGMKVDVTTTAAHANSRLLQVVEDGTERMAVATGGGALGGTIFLGGIAMLARSGNHLYVGHGGAGGINTLAGCRVKAASSLSFSANHFLTTTSDVDLYRDAAGVLAQRTGTAAQTSRVYNTYTDASNYERFAIRWNSNTLELITEAAGTGTLRDMSIAPSGGKLAFLGATPVARQAHVADASVVHALNATFSDTEVEAALDTLGTKLNSVLAALRSFGLLATS